MLLPFVVKSDGIEHLADSCRCSAVKDGGETLCSKTLSDGDVRE